MSTPERAGSFETDPFKLNPRLGRLRSLLQPLQERHRLAFAACCVDRLAPHYQDLALGLGVEDGLSPLVDRLWLHVLGELIGAEEGDGLLAACLALPLGSPGSRPCYGGALAAAGATWCALKAAVEGAAEDAARAAACVWDHLYRTLRAEAAEDGQEVDAWIERHPDTAEERRKQSNQIRFLYECEEMGAENVAWLRVV